MRVTASKVGLLAECGWWALPDAEWSSATSDAADRGTAFHEAIAHYIKTGKVPEVQPGIAGLLASAIAWVDAFGRSKLQAEVAFAWDPETDAAERLDVVGRDYSAARGRFCGTADLVSFDQGAKLGYLADWKTGDASRASPQLRALALMFARTYGLSTVVVEALEVTDTGVVSRCREILDEFAFAVTAGELAEQIAAVPGGRPKPGVHCAELYCPARATCPEATAIVAEVLPAESLVRHKWSLTIASPEHAAWLYEHAKLVESAAKAVKDAVKAYVPEGGLVLADGSTLAESTREMPRFDKAKALELLRKLGATEQDIEACTYRATESAGLRLSKPKRGKRAA